jgi:ribonuclease VapC
MPKPRALVFDSWAILAYLEDEPSAGKIADLIADAHEGGTPMKMSVVNAGEVWYIIARRTSPADANWALRLIEEIGIAFVDADMPLTKLAAGFKVKGNISYADCYAAALAKREKAALLTGDREFQQMEKEVRIIWL